ncbi:MAG: thioredoxin [Sphingomonadales bacterium]|jgi:thioredoxin 1
MASIAISDSEFQDKVLQAGKPVLVDFWAEWCGPCRQIGPSLEEISDEMGERVTVAKVNIDHNPEAPTRYGVRGIPTMILFKDGQVQATKVGALPKSKIVEWLEDNLG